MLIFYWNLGFEKWLIFWYYYFLFLIFGMGYLICLFWLLWVNLLIFMLFSFGFCFIFEDRIVIFKEVIYELCNIWLDCFIGFDNLFVNMIKMVVDFLGFLFIDVINICIKNLYFFFVWKFVCICVIFKGN